MKTKLLKPSFILILLLLQSIGMLAQVNIKGTVISDEGEPLIAVTVQEENTTKGTLTDTDGNYEITVSSETAVLVFSYTGYQTQKVAIDKNTVVDIVLKTGIDLEEVIVIGYQTIKKSDLTGSVSSISAEDIEDAGSISLENALGGRAAGVVVTQNSGTLGSGASIQIRGINSMNGSEPLYVIDGIPIENTSSTSLSESDEASGEISPLSMINPSDIQSLEILKDASATAIYGSRGSNGVVLITTKSGADSKSGDGTIQISTEYGISEIPKLIDVQTTSEYWVNRSTAQENSGGQASGSEAFLDSARAGLLENINWQQDLLRKGATSNTNLSISGKTGKIQYALSGNLLDAEGIVKRTNFQRIGTRAKLTAKVKHNLVLGMSLNYTNVTSDQKNTNTNYTTTNGTNSVLQRALRSSPILKDPNSTDNGIDFYTPIIALEANLYENTINQFIGSIYAEYAINDHLKFKTTVSHQNRATKQRFYQFDILPAASSRGGWAKTGDLLRTQNTNTNTLNYKNKFGNHRINFILGQSLEWFESESVKTSNYGFANDILTYYAPGTATFTTPDIFTFSDSRLASFFGRYNHNIGSKYLFTLTGRYDGSSKFAANNKWAFFPAAAFAYKLSEEKFIQDIKAISTLKLRITYGLSGKQSISPYQSLAQLTADQIGFGTDGQEALTAIFYSSQLPNPNLKWETTAQFDIGFDIGLFEDRITATADYYRKRTTDLLVAGNRIPAQSGFTTFTENLGVMEANGLEFGINAHVINRKDFKWSVSGVVSGGKTKIVDMNGDYILSGYNQGWISGGTQRLIVGEELGAFFGYETAGVSQFSDFEEFQGLTDEERIALYNSDRNATYTAITNTNGLGSIANRPGEQLYTDVNADGVIDDLDKKVIGHAQPDISFGIKNTLSYRNIDFRFFIDSRLGQEITNVMNFRLLAFDESQQLAVANEAWTPENQSNIYPRLDANNGGGSAFIYSDRYIEDASFIRLQNVTITYKFPKKLLDKVKIKGAQVYASGSNLYMLTTYSGFNPDVSLTRSNTLKLGHDSAGYPIARTIRFGMRVKI